MPSGIMSDLSTWRANFHIRAVIILIVILAGALAAWILNPPWWQYHQGMTLTG